MSFPLPENGIELVYHLVVRPAGAFPQPDVVIPGHGKMLHAAELRAAIVEISANCGDVVEIGYVAGVQNDVHPHRPQHLQCTVERMPAPVVTLRTQLIVAHYRYAQAHAFSVLPNRSGRSNGGGSTYEFPSCRFHGSLSAVHHCTSFKSDLAAKDALTGLHAGKRRIDCCDLPVAGNIPHRELHFGFPAIPV